MVSRLLRVISAALGLMGFLVAVSGQTGVAEGTLLPVRTLGFGEVSSIAFSPDGRLLAVGGINSVHLVDARSWQVIRTFEGHTASIRSVAFSPDGKFIASASADTTIKLWDVATGREIYTLQGHRDAANCVAFSADGQLLASGSDDWTAKLWNVNTGEEIATIKSPSGAVNCVAFSPDGRFLAIGLSGFLFGLPGVILYDISTMQIVYAFSVGRSFAPVNGLSFSPDGGLLAVGLGDGNIKLWDVKTRKEVCTLQGHTDAVLSVSFSPDGALLASASADNTIGIWWLESGCEEAIFLTGHSRPVASVAFSPDGALLVSGSRDKTVRVWDVATGRQTRTLAGHLSWITSLTFSPVGNLLASGVRISDQWETKVWDVETGREVRTITGCFPTAFSSDGKLLACASRDAKVKLIDVATGTEVVTFSDSVGMPELASFSWDGRYFACAYIYGYNETFVKVRELATGKDLYTLGPYRLQTPRALTFSRDSRVLALALHRGETRFIDASTGKEIRTVSVAINLLARTIFSAAISPDLKFVVYGLNWGEIIICDTETNEVWTIKGHNQDVKSVAFSPDGDLLASASRDGMIKIWAVGTWKQIRILKGHTGSVEAVTFSPDGKLLASASEDCTIKLWVLNELFKK